MALVVWCEHPVRARAGERVGEDAEAGTTGVTAAAFRDTCGSNFWLRSAVRRPELLSSKTARALWLARGDVCVEGERPSLVGSPPATRYRAITSPSNPV